MAKRSYRVKKSRKRGWKLTRKRALPKRASFKRRYGRRRSMSRMPPQPKFTRIVRRARVADYFPTMSANQEQTVNTSFVLTDVPGNAYYRAQWKEYRIVKIKEEFICKDNTNSINTQLYKGSAYSLPVVDQDYPSTLSELVQMGGREHQQGKHFSRTFVPSTRYLTNTTVAYNYWSYQKKRWHNTNPGGGGVHVPYYGFTYGFNTPVVGPADPVEWTRYERWITYTVEFRYPKLT